MTQNDDAEALIRLLDLQPHPEGGYFREMFRDGPSAGPAPEAGERAASTAIYFLLRDGEVSHWHRVDAAEVWHWYAGAPLELGISEPPKDGERASVRYHRLGNRLFETERPQAVVPAGAWQMARSLGAYTLVGCTVAPGFQFEGFELAPPGWSPV